MKEWACQIGKTGVSPPKMVRNHLGSQPVSSQRIGNVLIPVSPPASLSGSASIWQKSHRPVKTDSIMSSDWEFVTLEIDLCICINHGSLEQIEWTYIYVTYICYIYISSLNKCTDIQCICTFICVFLHFCGFSPAEDIQIWELNN